VHTWVLGVTRPDSRRTTIRTCRSALPSTHDPHRLHRCRLHAIRSTLPEDAPSVARPSFGTASGLTQRRGGRPRPSGGHARTIIRQTLTRAANGTMPRDVMALGGRQECANSGHSPVAWGTGQIDPELPFKGDCTNGREARESGRWPNEVLAPERIVLSMARATRFSPPWGEDESSECEPVRARRLWARAGVQRSNRGGVDCALICW
jgi:hypothetical protein